jgi:hypothetical protein
MKNKLLALLFGLCSMIGFAQDPPINDEPENAIEVFPVEGQGCSNPTSISLENSTLSAAFQDSAYIGDVWMKFTAIHETHQIIVTAYDEYQIAMITLYQDFTQPTNIFSPSSYSPSGPIYNNLIPGTEYFIRIFYNDYDIEDLNLNLGVCIISPASTITVTTDQYTTQQLVNDVLINSSCIQVSNITSSTGVNGNPTLPNGIGYFEKGDADFPFNSGIVLSTGNVLGITGHNTSLLSNFPGWGGDDDLLAIIQQLGSPTGTLVYDATKLEFDFVPVIDNIKFNFLFASEEYGAFQCTYSDTFAFFLTDSTTGITTNLALIPNTTTPVTVVTIRNSDYNSSCPSVNPDYFGNYYYNNPLSAPINLNGTTIPLTAQSAVEPGHQYHIKLVIGDRGDHAYDSAVFIDAGTFNIGALDGNGVALTSSNGNVFCGGGATQLSLNTSAPGATYLWSTGETTPTITVSEPGAYSLTISLSGESGCQVNYSITIVEAGPDQLSVTDYPIFDNDGEHIFNFDTKTAQIESFLGGENYVITYHLSLADAETNSNPLPTLYTNTANPQAIYVRIQNEGNNCYITGSFVLAVLDENYQTPPPSGETDQDFTDGQTLADIVLDGEDILWYPTSGETPGPPSAFAEEPLPLTTLLVDGTTYYASQTIYGIESKQRLPVTVHLTMGIQDNVFSVLKVHPNPVKDAVKLSAQHPLGQVTLYTIVGQPVFSKNFTDTAATIDMAPFAKGIYLLKIQSANGQKTVKIIKE